jgi:hypothetical protein
MPSQPACEKNVAPRSEPMIACDELVGRPLYHVIKFQMIAAMTVYKTVCSVIVSASTSPLPIVAATSVPINAPRKFNTAP